MKKKRICLANVTGIFLLIITLYACHKQEHVPLTQAIDHPDPNPSKELIVYPQWQFDQSNNRIYTSIPISSAYSLNNLSTISRLDSGQWKAMATGGSSLGVFYYHVVSGQLIVYVYVQQLPSSNGGMFDFVIWISEKCKKVKVNFF